MIRKLFFIVLLIFNFSLFSQADWTIFTYIEASEKLQLPAIYNINQIAEGEVPSNVNMIVQLHITGENAYIYKIENNHIILLGTAPLKPNAKNNIISTMKTIATLYPATHYGLILWNHGFGILEPTYNAEKDSWDIEPDDDTCGYCDLCSVDPTTKKKRHCNEHMYHKGLLVDAHYQTVMNNADMIELAKTVSEDILGKKIDLFGFDCCMGAMLEHAYQLKDYAHYMVGSQDCELADGWNYKKLMIHFQTGHTEPKQIAQDIVYDYGSYNEKHAQIGRYTMSAFDLAYTELLKKNINQVSHWLLELIKGENQLFKNIIFETRASLVRFCMTPSYTDIYHLYHNLHENLKPYNNLIVVQKIQELLSEGKELVQKAVVANIAGPVNKHAQGISIYFPFSHIDSSYQKTIFAQETTWLTFLKNLLG